MSGVAERDVPFEHDASQAGADTAEWDEFLKRLERQLRESEPTVAEWQPPAADLPAHLAERVRVLVRAQQERMQRTRAELADIRAHLDALRHVRGTAADAAPAYLDVDG